MGNSMFLKAQSFSGEKQWIQEEWVSLAIDDPNSLDEHLTRNL